MTAKAKTAKASSKSTAKTSSAKQASAKKSSAEDTGTRANPWKLTTPSGSSEYQMYRAESADPPALVCTVGKTELRYHLRAVDEILRHVRAEA